MLRRSSHAAPFYLLLALHAALLIALALAKHWSGMSSLGDLGVHDQALWTFQHLGVPLSTLNPPYETAARFGWHFSPIILALTPLYALGLPVESLIVVHCLAITLSAVPLRAALRKLEIGSVFPWVLLYLFNPLLLNAAMWGFRETALALPLLALALWAVAAKRFGMLILCCLLLMLCKEHLGLAVAGLGMFWAARHKQWGNGFVLTAMGFAGAVWITLSLMPALSGTAHPMLVEGDGVTSRFGWVLSEPERLAEVLLSRDSFHYLLLLLGPLLALPLLAPAALLPGMADLTLNLLSANSIHRSAFSYHSLLLAPVLVFAAALAAQRLRKTALKPAKICAAMLAATLAFAWYFFPYPLPGSADPWKLKAWRLQRPEAVAEIQALTERAPLSGQLNIGSYFSARPIVTPFPKVREETRFLVIHLGYPLKDAAYAPFGLPYGLGNEEYIEHVEYYLRSKQWGVAYWRDPWLVFERGRTEDAAPRGEIRTVLQSLKLMLLPEELSHTPEGGEEEGEP